MKWILVVTFVVGHPAADPVGISLFETEAECWAFSTTLKFDHMSQCMTVDQSAAAYPELSWP